MATEVILPALGMSQDTGKIVHWLKAEGEQVAKGEPLVEIETDKATVEIEAPASGLLMHIVAVAAEVPVGQVIAVILAPGEAFQRRAEPLLERRPTIESGGQHKSASLPVEVPAGINGASPQETGSRPSAIATSLLASRIAAEHQVDLGQVQASGPRVQKADVLAYLQKQHQSAPTPTDGRLVRASPKARRLAREQGKDLAAITGTGPEGAVLAGDVLASLVPENTVSPGAFETATAEVSSPAMSTIWRIMGERTAQSWTSVPHFYLVREANASGLSAWRAHFLKQKVEDITYTDLLVKIVAAALGLHPRLNATWSDGKINLRKEVHIGLAVAVEDGLVVPVIHHADRPGLHELARQRRELVAKARAGKLRPQDLSDGTFTISNLGMYGIDAFNAIINAPQVAILAVGRIAERVVPLNGQPAIQPMITLTLSCDHRVIDGARGSQFLDAVASLIEEPLGLLD